MNIMKCKNVIICNNLFLPYETLIMISKRAAKDHNIKTSKAM